MKIAIAGAAGRMGQMLIRQIASTPGCSLVSALRRAVRDRRRAQGFLGAMTIQFAGLIPGRHGTGERA